MLVSRPLLVPVAIGLATSSLVFGPVPARADGVPIAASNDDRDSTDWSGVYVGGKLGGLWSDVGWSQNTNYFTTLGPTVVGTDSSFAPSGFAGGIIGGANVQHGQWIFGAELSFSGTDLSEARASPFFPAIDSFTTELDWLATVEGRIGYAWDRLLVFGKAGWAGGNVSLTLTDNVAGVFTSGKTFASGWTIGGGIEYARWRNIILGLEYSYTSLSFHESLNCPGCGTDTSIGDGPPSISGDIRINAAMARLSYLFRPED